MSTYLDKLAGRYGYPDLQSWVNLANEGDPQALTDMVSADFVGPASPITPEEALVAAAFQGSDWKALSIYRVGQHLTARGTELLLNAWGKQDQASL